MTPASPTAPNALAPLDLAALMCARVCHDFSNRLLPIGAAIDVLSDTTLDAEMKEDALGLLSEAGEFALAKIELVRAAFATAPQPGAMMKLEDLRKLFPRAFSDRKLTFDWRCPVDTLPYETGRMLVNLVMLASEAVMGKGEITLECGAGGDRLRVAGQGRRVRLDDAIAAAFDGKVDATEPARASKNIQAYFAGELARSLGGRASARIDGETVEFAALIPVAAPGLA